MQAAQAALAQATLGQKISLCTKMLWETTTAWISAHAAILAFAGAIVAAIAIAGIVNVKFYDGWKKKVEELQNTIDKNKEIIQTTQEEVESLELLKSKLEDAKGDKAKLASIQEELNDAIGETPGLVNGEADAYTSATAKINDQIRAKEQLIKLKQQENLEKNIEKFDSIGVTAKLFGIDWLAGDMSGDDARVIQKNLAEYKAQLITEGKSNEEIQELLNERWRQLMGFYGSSVTITQ